MDQEKDTKETSEVNVSENGTPFEQVISSVVKAYRANTGLVTKIFALIFFLANYGYYISQMGFYSFYNVDIQNVSINIEYMYRCIIVTFIIALAAIFFILFLYSAYCEAYFALSLAISFVLITFCYVLIEWILFNHSYSLQNLPSILLDSAGVGVLTVIFLVGLLFYISFFAKTIKRNADIKRKENIEKRKYGVAKKENVDEKQIKTEKNETEQEKCKSDKSQHSKMNLREIIFLVICIICATAIPLGVVLLTCFNGGKSDAKGKLDYFICQYEPKSSLQALEGNDFYTVIVDNQENLIISPCKIENNTLTIQCNVQIEVSKSDLVLMKTTFQSVTVER